MPLERWQIVASKVAPGGNRVAAPRVECCQHAIKENLARSPRCQQEVLVGCPREVLAGCPQVPPGRCWLGAPLGGAGLPHGTVLCPRAAPRQLAVGQSRGGRQGWAGRGGVTNGCLVSPVQFWMSALATTIPVPCGAFMPVFVIGESLYPTRARREEGAICQPTLAHPWVSPGVPFPSSAGPEERARGWVGCRERPRTHSQSLSVGRGSLRAPGGGEHGSLVPRWHPH